MNGQAFQFGSILIGAALMLSLLGLGFAVIMPGIDRWSKRFFTVFFIILVLYAGFNMIEAFIDMRPDRRWVLDIAYYFETLFASVMMPLMTVYLLHCCGENRWRSPLFRAETVLWIAFVILLSFTPFTTGFYHITPENQFYRGPLYVLLIIPLVAMQILNLAGVIRWRSRLSK